MTERLRWARSLAQMKKKKDTLQVEKEKDKKKKVKTLRRKQG